MRSFLALLLTSIWGINAYAVHVEFTALYGNDIAQGFFQWDSSAPVIAEALDSSGNGKILWDISGSIVLNGGTLSPMTNVVLEVMNNWFIDAPIPNTLIGDQFTLFGTAVPQSGLFSVQNFYFRDETSLLLNSIMQPYQQYDFDQFSDVRVDLFLPGVGRQTFDLDQWKVSQIPTPSTALLLLSGLIYCVFRKGIYVKKRGQ